MAENFNSEVIPGTVSISIMHIVTAGKYWVSIPAGQEMSEVRRSVKESEENLTLLLKDSFGIPCNLPVNKLIAVKNSKTGCWHRGELLSHLPETSTNKVKVFLVDHGAFLMDIKPQELQILPKDMHQLPHLAFITCLYGLIPLTVDVHLEDINDKMHFEESPFWTPASEIFVQQLISDSISAQLKGIVCVGHIVHGEIILNIPGEGLISLNKELIKNKYAFYSEEKYKKVIEREALLERKLAQKKKLISKVDEKEEEESAKQNINISQGKHMLMEEFIKEYTSKKSVREESTAGFLNEIRSTLDLNSFKQEDARRREVLRNSILSSPTKALGRGFNLKRVEESSPRTIPKGRDLSVVVENEKKRHPPLPVSRSHPVNTTNSVLSLLDLLKYQGNPKDGTDKEMGNSVLSLGHIPAGYPPAFNEFPLSSEKKPNKSVRVDQDTMPLGRRTILFQQSESLVQKRVPMSDGDLFNTTEFQKENLATSYKSDSLKGMSSKPINEIFNANVPQIATKVLGLKSELEYVFPQRREKECFLKEKSASFAQQSSNIVKVCDSFNRKKILNMIQNSSENAHSNFNFVASNEEVVNLQKDDLCSESPQLENESDKSTFQSIKKIHFLIADQYSHLHRQHNKPDPATKEEAIQMKCECKSQSLPQGTEPASFPVKKIQKLMKLQSQSDEPCPAIKEEGAIQSSMSKKKELENKSEKSVQGKVTTPLHSLLDIMKKKKVTSKRDSENVFKHLEKCNDRQTGNFSQKDLKTNSESSVNKVDSNLGNNKSFEGCYTDLHHGKNLVAPSHLISERVECQEKMPSFDNSTNMYHKVALEKHPSVLKKDVATNRISHLVSNDDMRSGEEKDVMVLSGHASQDITSPPEKIKAAIDLFAEAMRELEGSNEDNPFVMNLASLRNELASIGKSVIEQSRNKLSLAKDEKQYSNDFRIKPESSTSHSPVTQESFITEKHDISDEKVISVDRECEREKAMTTTIVETDISSTCINDANLASKMSVNQNNFAVQSNSPFSLHDSNKESNVSGISGSGLNNTSEKSDHNYHRGNSRDSPKVTSHVDIESEYLGVTSTKSAETEVNYVEDSVEICKSLPSRTIEMNELKEKFDLLSELNPECRTHSSVNLKKETVLPVRNQVIHTSAAQDHESPLNDDYVSRKISSFAKLMSRIEAKVKSKTYNAIKDEGVPLTNLSARLPLCILPDLNKSKSSSSSLNSNFSLPRKPNLPSASVEIEAMEIQKQKTLEPEMVSPQIVSTDNLPPLLKNSWLSGPGMENCLFTAHRHKMCRILVRGHFLAQRITSIAQATFSKSLHMSLSKMGFRDPMRIQSYAWPALMRGHNLIMVNPPHSGKTLAYLVPIISFMLSSDLYSELPIGNGPLVLILCSSWKGVMQVNDFCNCLLSEINSQVKVIATYGGTEMEQVLSLINGCHILISTPRCYIRLLKNDSITTNVERLCHLVFDEADTLMKVFMPEVKEVLRECHLLLQRRARLAAEANPTEDAQSYTMVKIVAAAKSWCPQMESFVMSIVEKPLLCIGSYLEAAVYARLKPVLHLVGFGTSKGGEREDGVVNESAEKKSTDIDEVVVGILKKKVGLYKIVVACDSEVEVMRLAPKIKDLGIDVLLVHENVHHVNRAEALDFWMCSNRSGALPVLIVSDEALPEVNIGDAEHLVHVGIPTTSKTQFGLRFSTLMDNYHDIFDKVSTDEKNGRKINCFVDIIVDLTKPEVDISELIDFLQRLGMTIPPELDAAASKSMLSKEMMRKKNVDLCPSLKSFGVCCESVCSYRHVVLADVDKPSKGIPTCGEVRVKILNVLDASHMSVRLLEHIAPDGTKRSLPDDYYFIASALDRYFARMENRIPHGHPRVGDLCAYEIDVDLFHRARVDSVFYSNPDIKIPEAVTLNIIDKGIKTKTKAYELLYLPDDLKKYPAQAQELIVCKMHPRDLDMTWGKAACIKVAKWLECEVKGEVEGKVIVGKVMLALGNTMWVDPLECQEWLENHKTTVIHLSLRHDLIRAGLAIDNPSHIEALKKLCEIANLQFPSPQPSKDVIKKDITDTNSQLELDKQRSSPVLEWLSFEQLIEVNVSEVDSPSCFRLQKASNSERLKDLSKNIQLWISDLWQKSLSKNSDNIKEYSMDSFCLGFLEADNSWHRAKVISLIKSTVTDSSHPETENGNHVDTVKLVQYKLYFVDYGDTAIVSQHEIAPIPDKFISRLPFQAIECSLLGVSPLEKDSDSSNYSNVEWNQDACDAFYELCREGVNLDIFRPLLAKVFGTEGTCSYGGTKYLVVLYDIGNKCPTRIGDLLAERGLARCRQVVSDIGDDDDELEEHEMDFNWIDEGALVPLTPALTSPISLQSSEIQLESSTISTEDSNCTDVVAAKESWNGSSENRQSSAEDEDSDSYEVVMYDDEVEFYEERLRRLLGIPPRGPVTEPEGENCSLNSNAIEKVSSLERIFEDGGDQSSFTRFEDLTGNIQQSCEGIEDILEENGDKLIDLKITIPDNEECKTTLITDKDIVQEMKKDDSKIDDNVQCLQSSKNRNLKSEYLRDKSDCASSKLKKGVTLIDESQVFNIDDSTKDSNIPKDIEILSSDCGLSFSLLEDACDSMDEKEKDSSDILIKGIPEKDSIISPYETDNLRWRVVEDSDFSFRNKSDSNNPSDVNIFYGNIICDKLNDKETQDENSLGDDNGRSSIIICEELGESLMTVPIKSATDHINSEEEVAVRIVEKEDIEVLNYTNKLPEVPNKEIWKNVKEMMAFQKERNGNVNDVQSKAFDAAAVAENSKHNVQLSEVTNTEMSCNSEKRIYDINNIIDDNSEVVQSRASDVDVPISTSSESTIGVSESNVDNVRNTSEAFTEETDLNVTEEEEKNTVLCNFEDEQHKGSMIDECFEVIPDLVQAKIPSIKWSQNKREIILKLNLLNMNRYNVHWEENNKLCIFASSDFDNESRYMVELILWASVDVENCEHMAISDNVVKVYMRKAFAFMEWPRLLLDPIKPLWLSVDFDLMEFEEEFSENVTTTKLVSYQESEDESSSEDEMEPDYGVRCEEINYDPYDPLS